MRRPLLITLIVVFVATAGYAAARIKRDFWDYEVIRQAGMRAAAAEPLYRPEDGHYQFKYWPAFALAVAPLGALDLEVGKVLWYAMTVALIGVFIRQSVRALPDRRSSERFLVWWTLLVTGKFLVKDLVNGQTNLILGVLVMLMLVAGEAGRPVRAGIMMALAAVAKPYAIIFLPWLAVAYGVAAGLVGLTALIVAWLAPALVYGWNGNLALLADWYRTVTQTTPPNLSVLENSSIASMWVRWIGQGSAAWVLTAATIAVCVAAAALLWSRRREVKRPAFLEVGYLLLLIPLLSPQGWDYVLLIATPAFVCLVDRFRESPRGWQIAVAFGFFLTSFMVYDLVGRTLYFWLMEHSAIAVGALVLAACLIRLRLVSAA